MGFQKINILQERKYTAAAFGLTVNCNLQRFRFANP
jgi:hypothetical protein